MRSALFLPLMSLTIALALAHGTSLAQDHVEIDPRQVLAEFDIYKDGDAIIVPVEIAGKSYRFAVSTGTTHTSFDTSFAGLLGAPIATSPAGPKWHVEPDGKVGKLSLQTGKPVLVGDLTRLRGLTGHALDGILGMSFLSTQVIRLDFDRGKLYFLKGSGMKAGDSFPLYFDPQGKPVVEVEVPGAGKRWFVLDMGQVGCVSGDLDRYTFADLLGKGHMTRVAELRPSFMMGTEAPRWGEVQGISLGTIALPSLSLREGDLNNLGLAFLSRFNVTLDFPCRRLYLTKNKRFSEPDRVDRSGMLVVRERGDTIVALVNRESPAEASGIRPGDTIMKVGGKNASEMRLRSLKLLFCEDGKTMPITIRRGQQEMLVTLRLGSWPLQGTIKANHQDVKGAKEKGGEEKSATDEHR